MAAFTYVAGSGRCRVYGRFFDTAAGYIVHLMGGTRPHVGAVALGWPRPSLAGRRLSATASVLTLTAHKDDELARPAALALAAGLKAAVVVVAGVHIEAAAPADLDRLEFNAWRVIAGILKVQRWQRGNPVVLK